MNRNIFLPALMAMIVDAMGFGLVYPLMTELFAGEEGLHMAAHLSLPLRHFYLGLIFLLYPLAAFFGVSWMNELAEIYGRKTILVICMAGQTLSFLLMGIGVSLFSILLLMIGRTLSGLMAGSQMIAQSVLIEKTPLDMQRRTMNLLTVVIAVGIVLGPLMGGLFSDTELFPLLTLSTPFYIAASLALLTTLWLAWGFPPLLGNKPTHTFSLIQPLKLFFDGFVSKKIGSLVWILALMQIGFSLFFQLIQVFVSQNFDFPSWEIGIFNGYLGIAFALAVVFGIKILLKFLSLHVLAALSLLATALCLIVAMIYPQEWFVWVTSFLAAGANMMAFGALIALFSQAVSTERQTWSMMVFGCVMGAMWVLTGFSTNLINIIGLRWLIAIGGLFLLASSVLMAILTMKNQPHKI